jgi:N-acetylglucosaminyldiphosphoundecaprenol N-acetyl-beta-D-mannosaminyltransferase
MSTSFRTSLARVQLHPHSLRRALFNLECLAKSSFTRAALVCTVNSDFIVTANRNPAFLRVLNQIASLCLVDGFPVALLGGLRTGRVLPRATGADLTELLLRRGHREGYKAFLFGDTRETQDAVERRLRLMGGERALAGAISPSHSQLRDVGANRSFVAQINHSGADLLLIALGTPQGEFWAANWLPQLKVKVAMGVGSSLRYFGRTARRAPRGMRALGLEWLFRLAAEPTRLGPRYLRDVSLIWWAARSWVLGSRPPGGE